MKFTAQFWLISRKFLLKNGDVVNINGVSYNLMMWINDQQLWNYWKTP